MMNKTEGNISASLCIRNLSVVRNVMYLSIFALLPACSSDDGMQIQHSKEYDYITFDVNATKAIERANAYEAYDHTRHPATMGVFGYFDISSYDPLNAAPADASLKANPIFNNETVTYDLNNRTWGTQSLKRWDDYKGANTTYDFFAYMPHTTAEAKVTRTATDTYMLSVPFTMPSATDGDVTPAPILFDTKDAPLICAKPENKRNTTADGKQFAFERVVKMLFDQTMTGYTLFFRLDPTTDAIRHFIIKGVTIKGELTTAATVTRTYTWNGTEWSAAKIQWKDYQRANVTGITLQQAEDDQEAFMIPTKEYRQWGNTFYAIPDQKFNPTISVTYDVEFTDQDGKTVKTRNVTSDIELNSNNFKGLTTGATATVNPVQINIKPRYLYVLADQDAYTGNLLIE